MNNDNKQLEFTGERFTPECEREIWYEHYHRYAFAKKLVKDKDILDIASGEGYGSAILADYAKSVTAIDIDVSSIDHANNKYHKDNLTYQQGSCLQIPCDDNCFDVVVSFETLEHLAEQTQMLAEINRVLKVDGLLIISTPDKKHYSDATGFTNEFHVKELYKHEFQELLDAHWKQQIWYAQAMSFHSVLEKLDNDEIKKRDNCYSSDILDVNNFIQDDKLLNPMYYIVVATKQKKQIVNLPDLHLFADKSQSIYGHYNAVIRAHIEYLNKYTNLKIKYDKLFAIPVLGKILSYFIKNN